MLSLYIHIPFCDQKCGYCSFNVLPIDGKDAISKLIDPYVEALCKQIAERGTKMNKPQVNTIYFGGGTPTRIGADNLAKIIDTISAHFDIELLVELTIECNPFPQDEVLSIIETITRRYHTFGRIRRSIGIQTFDEEVLQESGRLYSFPAICDFLRKLRNIKQINNIYNLDFIAFGKRNTDAQWQSILRDADRRHFFQKLILSGMADGISLYTLELFPGSDRYNQQIQQTTHIKDGLWLRRYGDDDAVYEEFQALKQSVINAWYGRYEISNFAMPGKLSIHNNTYREMGNYIGFGTSASSCLTGDLVSFAPQQWAQAVRWTNTKAIADFCRWEYIDASTIQALDEQDYRIEKAFLALRTSHGLQHVSSYADLFVSDWAEKLEERMANDYVFYAEDTLVLQDEGMDVYNTIITELFEKL